MNMLRSTKACPVLLTVLVLCIPAFADISTIFIDEMNSGALNSKININATGVITPSLSYLASGGITGPISGVAGGYTQYRVNSTGAGNPWYAGFGYYGANGVDSPIHYTIPSFVALQDISFTFDGKAAGGTPLNVGVRVEAWDQTNSNQLGTFYLLPLTITGSFQQIGGTLSSFQFYSSTYTALQAKNLATDWRFNFSFAGNAAGPNSADDAYSTYGDDSNNVLGLDNVYFRYSPASATPEPDLRLMVPLGALILLIVLRIRTARVLQ